MAELDAADEKSFIEEVREQFHLYMLYRRYQQKKQAGQLPWEDRVINVITDVSLHRSLRLIKHRAVISWRKSFKRSLDFLFSVGGIVSSAPVMAFIALAIKLDSRGPVLFKQTRVGKRGKLFTIYKFRTMQEGAEEATGPVWAKENDPRITRMGTFLRRTHLDELPQIFNVLRGEMSLVGPRPERPHFVQELRRLIPHYDRRLCVKPGITGLAQLKRRYDETISDVKKKVRYDVLYARKMCPLLDIRLLFMTVSAVVLRTGR